jgi:hypothetical protein
VIFAIVKVLLVEVDIVHVRGYREKFRDRPIAINSALLSQGNINDPAALVLVIFHCRSPRSAHGCQFAFRMNR